MTGIVKITNSVWNNKKLRRALLKVIKPLKVEEDMNFDIRTIKCESKFFTEKYPEGGLIPVYDMVFRQVDKKVLFWKFKRIEFKECKAVKQSNIIPAAPALSLKNQRDKFLKRN